MKEEKRGMLISFAHKTIRSLITKHRLKSISKYGENIRVAKNCNFQGEIVLGSNISIGMGAHFVSTKATLHIHSNTLIAPNVTIYTGDHPIHVIGKHISEITDQDKDKLSSKFDSDVVIEEGCWIGTRAIILKGVTIGRGSVIGAGAVVTRSVPPYSVYVGVPAAKIFPRFTEEEIREHERILAMRQGENLQC